jgi:hypothetical protein
MTEETRIANRYRRHAEELRVIAESDRNMPTHDTLMRIAADYEKMAETMSELDKSNRSYQTRIYRS